MEINSVIGRFAPTPSGPLHFGSLVTAVASYCEARSLNGKWLLRIEDVDTPRNVEGATDDILFTLEAFGFEWDGEVEYQSEQFDRYQAVLESLLNQRLCYACECSRRTLRDRGAEIGPLGLIYSGFCREKYLDEKGHSIRVNSEDSGLIQYADQLYGSVEFNIPAQLGDFVLRRADGIYAYHLAVVIDDERQGVNQIVRGADLLEATCLHILLQQQLGYRIPEYLHVPLVRNEAGDKLSKQTGASGIVPEQKITLLIRALETLGQTVDSHMYQGSVSEILESAIMSWNHEYIKVPKGNIY